MYSVKHLLLALAVVALMEPLAVWSKPQRFLPWFPWYQSPGISGSSGSNSQSANLDQTQNNQEIPSIAINTDLPGVRLVIGDLSTVPASDPPTTQQPTTTAAQLTSSEAPASEGSSSAAPLEESSAAPPEESSPSADQ